MTSRDLAENHLRGRGSAGRVKLNKARFIMSKHEIDRRQNHRGPHFRCNLPRHFIEIGRGRANRLIRPIDGPVFLVGAGRDCDLVLGDQQFPRRPFLLIRKIGQGVASQVGGYARDNDQWSSGGVYGALRRRPPKDWTLRVLSANPLRLNRAKLTSLAGKLERLLPAKPLPTSARPAVGVGRRSWNFVSDPILSQTAKKLSRAASCFGSNVGRILASVVC